MRLAAIDIGTNTVLLLVADVGPDGSITTVVSVQRMPRLGRGVDAAHHLAPDSMRRAVEVLREYRSIVDRHGPEHVSVCGTSAVRDAANRDEFAAMVKAETGFDLEVMSGSEESRWTYRGAISGLPGLDRAAVLDIGGGSTELSVGNAGTLLESLSMNVGSVRLTERFLHSDPPAPGELADARREIRAHLERTKGFATTGGTLIAVAGTATSLAILAQGLPRFTVEAVTNYRLSRLHIADLLSRLATLPVREIRRLSDVMEGRADVIVAGALILAEIMDAHAFPEAIVSDRGVRYGIVVRDWERRRA